MPTLYYQGHGSFRLQTDAGMVIYIDPFAGDGYDLPADLILVTHEHSDHNQLSLVPRKPGCQIITEKAALAGGMYQQFSINGVQIEAVEAHNQNHDPRYCVGYLITIDQVSLYAAGDTSKTATMPRLAERKLDYALLPADGIYNMDLPEAAECAKLIGAKHTIPIHLKPGALFSRERAERFDAPGRLILAPGSELAL